VAQSIASALNEMWCNDYEMINWMLKKMVITYLKVLSWHFPGGTDENFNKHAKIASLTARV
jgi:hypothetical protein